MLDQLKHALEKIRTEKPLILNLTNTVTRDLMANGLLALGAGPLMCDSPEEVVELTHLAQALNINIGTLNVDFMAVVERALPAPCPVILDPVGCGASRLRTTYARQLLPFATLVRGNGSEIMALTDLQTRTMGVESLHPSVDALAHAQALYEAHGLTCVISGATDYVVGNGPMQSFSFGSPLMAAITGMGCTLTALIAAFHAVEKEPFTAACLATAYVGLAGSQAARVACAPGAFRSAFIDRLYAPDWTFIEEAIENAR